MTFVRPAFLFVLTICLRVVAFGATAEQPPPTQMTNTEIESVHFEMISTEKESTFTFSDQVVVTATNLKLTCDRLVVVARRGGDPTAVIGNQEKFKSLVATGRVRILQSDREATCERADVLPGEDKIILSGKLVVRSLDDTFTQTGEKGTLYRGERRVVIEGTPTERPRITLPPLKDLGYEKQPEKKAAPLSLPGLLNRPASEPAPATKPTPAPALAPAPSK